MTITLQSLRAALAASQHEIWAHWMKYQFSCCPRYSTGVSWEQPPGFTGRWIPTDKVERWERQAATPYAELTEKEQASDLEQADKILALPEVQALLAENEKMRAALLCAIDRTCIHSSVYARDVCLAAEEALGLTLEEALGLTLEEALSMTRGNPCQK